MLDKLTDPPTGGDAQKWIAGAIFPGILLIYSMSCFLYGYATIVYAKSNRLSFTSRPLNFVTINGATMGWYIALVLSIAAYCHFQWYWGNDRKLVYYYEPFRLLALVALVGFLLFNVLRVLVYF